MSMSMDTTGTKFDFRTATDSDLALRAFRSGQAHFTQMEADELLKPGEPGKPVSLYLSVVRLQKGNGYEVIGNAEYGTDAARYAANVSDVTGKLATVVQYRVDTGTAKAYFELTFDDDDPRGWTGGVYLEVSDRLDNGEVISIRLGGAASGVQGPFDAATMRTVLSTLAAGMIERAKAQLAAAA
jgi:hypothetical protein